MSHRHTTADDGWSTDLRPDDRRADPDLDDSPERSPATGPFAFLLLFVALVAGLWLMGWAVHIESQAWFWAGLLVSGLAFLVPQQLLRD